MLLELSAALRLKHPDGSCVGLAPRDAALLAWLALEGPTPRSRLALLLWPASEPEAARNTLRQRLFQLKRQCGALVGGSTRLALADGVRHDLHAGAGVLGELRFDSDAPEFDAWLQRQREQRRSARHRGLAEQARALEDTGELEHATALAEVLLREAPLSESAHRRLMRLHYLRGDRAAALLAFDACERMLKDDVGAAPAAETLALLATIEGSRTSDVPAVRAPPASVLRPPRLIGRAAELVALQQALAAGEVAALIGEAGMGKSRLLQALAASRPGVHITSARPGDGAVPYATLARVLRAAVPRGAAIAAPDGPGTVTASRSELARVLPDLAGLWPHGGTLPHASLAEAVAAGLQGLGAALQVLVVDDLHFADAASLELLQSLARGDIADTLAPAPRLRWVFALRPAEATSAAQALLDALAERGALHPVRLQALNVEQIAELVDSLALPGVHGAALAETLRRRSGGNPLFLLETLKQAWVDGRLGDALDAADTLPRPATVGALIERRLAQLSPGALALARVAAIAGTDFSVELAEAALGVSALQFADALAELEAAQVLRDTQFAHDLVAEAAGASLPAAIARHLHARIAAWLEQTGAAAARVAAHWVQAEDAARAVPALLGAAADAAAALRPREQCAFLLQAADCQQRSGQIDAAFDTLHACIETQHDVVRGADPDTLCERLDALARSPRQQARARQQRGWVALNRGALASAASNGEAFLAAAQQADDAALIADAHQLIGLALSLQGEEGERSLDHLYAALPWVQAHASARERSEFHGTLAVALGNRSRLSAAMAHNEQALQAALECGYGAQQVIVRGNLALALRASGRLEAAHEQLQQAERLRLQHDQLDGAVNSLAAAMALVAHERGDYREALARSDQAEQVLARQAPSWLPLVQARRAATWLALGQATRARQALAAIGDMAGSPGFVQATRWLIEARVLAAAGQDVRPWLARARSLASEHGRLELWFAIAIEEAARLGPADALARLEPLIERARSIGHHASELAARVQAAACAASLDAATALRHAQAVLVLRRQHAPIQTYAPALWLELAKALSLLGETGAAQALLLDAAAALRDGASRHVPGEFVDSFLHRNPVNRELLARAAAAAAPP